MRVRVVVAASLVACNGLLGIEEAHLADDAGTSSGPDANTDGDVAGDGSTTDGGADADAGFAPLTCVPLGERDIAAQTNPANGPALAWLDAAQRWAVVWNHGNAIQQSRADSNGNVVGVDSVIVSGGGTLGSLPQATSSNGALAVVYGLHEDGGVTPTYPVLRIVTAAGDAGAPASGSPV